MKKIIISLVVLSCLASSCTDFITHDQRGKQTVDNYFQTTTECQTYINGLYASTFSYNDWWTLITELSLNDIASDDAWMGNTDQSQTGNTPAAYYLMTPNLMGFYAPVYPKRYRNISDANTALSKIPNSPISDADKNQYEGEALFFRAYNYFDLVNDFGGVPLVLKPLSTTDLNLTRSSKEEVYGSIETDLLDAASKLPTSYDSNNKGRVSKYACQALLARTYLFEEKWQQAYTYADSVINSGAFSLEPNFIDIWSCTNHNGMESILEAQTTGDETKSLGNMQCTYSCARGESKDFFPSASTSDVMDGWGWCVPTSDLENCYLSENDVIRRRATITVTGDPVYGDETDNPTYDFPASINKSGRVIRKYYVPVAVRRTLIDKGHAPLDVPIIRLAEMYLTRAEAAYHLNNPAQALSDIDVLRARVNLSPKSGTLSGAAVLRAVWKERRMELAFEGLRLWDIRREIDPTTGKPVIENLFGPNGSFVIYNTQQSTDKYETTNPGELQDEGIHFDPNKNLLWPIPQTEIDRSNGVITQNPGY